MAKNSRYILISLFLLFLLTSCSTPDANAEYTEPNLYVTEYLRTKTEELDLDPLVDPDVEEQTIIETLNDYYLGDLKVKKILSDHDIEAEILKQVTTLNRDDKVKVMHKIIEIYDSINNEESKELLYEFVDRYVHGPKDTDPVAMRFLEKIWEK